MSCGDKRSLDSGDQIRLCKYPKKKQQHYVTQSSLQLQLAVQIWGEGPGAEVYQDL